MNDPFAGPGCEQGKPEGPGEIPTDGDKTVTGEPAQVSPIQQVSGSPEEIRNPLIAALCSTCCIGLGQFYNGRTGDGILIWLCVLVPVALVFIFPVFFEFFIFMGIGGWMYGIFDAYSVARKINKKEFEFNGISELFFFPVLIFVSFGCAFAAYWLINALI